MQPASARSASEQSGPEARAALRLLAAVLGAAGNPFVSCKRAADFYVHLHFLHFAKLFHARLLSTPAISLCLQHLQVFFDPIATSPLQTAPDFQALWLSLDCPCFVFRALCTGML